MRQALCHCLKISGDVDKILNISIDNAVLLESDPTEYPPDTPGFHPDIPAEIASRRPIVDCFDYSLRSQNDGRSV